MSSIRQCANTKGTLLKYNNMIVHSKIKFKKRWASVKINIVDPVSYLCTHVLYIYRTICVMNVRSVFLQKHYFSMCKTCLEWVAIS